MVRRPREAEHRRRVAHGEARDDRPGGGRAQRPLMRDERDDRRYGHEGGEQEDPGCADREQPTCGHLLTNHSSGYSAIMHRAMPVLPSSALLALGLLLRPAR